MTRKELLNQSHVGIHGRNRVKLCRGRRCNYAGKRVDYSTIFKRSGCYRSEVIPCKQTLICLAVVDILCVTNASRSHILSYICRLVYNTYYEFSDN